MGDVRQPADKHPPFDGSMRFGDVFELIRLHKPRSRPGRVDYPAMTQAELATNLTMEWYKETGELRVFDTASMRKLRRGKVRVDRRIAECIARALHANEFEKALLLQAAGYDGMSALLLKVLGIPPVKLEPDFENLCNGRLTLDELYTIVLIQMQARVEELKRRLSEGDI